MGHPVNNISYVLNEWNYLKREGFPFYAFILFRKQDRTFAEFFQQHFEILDEYSAGACMFFAIASPPINWSEQAEERQYWQHYLANVDKGFGYSDVNVVEAAQYFDLNEEQLPAIVIFRDIKYRDFIVTRLGGLDSEELLTFFYNLFELFRNSNIQRMAFWKVRFYVDYLPFHNRVHPDQIIRVIDQYDFKQGKKLPADFSDGPYERTIRIESSTRVEERLQNIENYLEKLSGQIREFQEESRGNFGQVNIKLDRVLVELEGISERIEKERKPLFARFIEIDEMVDDPYDRLLAREKLFDEFDEFLLGQVHKISQEFLDSGCNFDLPDAMRYFDGVLETQSFDQLKTAELLWQNVKSLPVDFPFDYSVCAIGLWKSLEVETNRTFVDALRVHNDISSSGYSSIGQPYRRKGSLSEKGLFPQKTKPKDINITGTTNDHLLNMTLAPIAALVAYGENNSLKTIFQYIPSLPEYSNSPITYFGSVAEDIRIVATHYRNSHAHVQNMDRQICHEFRQFMFTKRDSNPLLFTLNCKKSLLQAKLI